MKAIPLKGLIESIEWLVSENIRIRLLAFTAPLALILSTVGYMLYYSDTGTTFSNALYHASQLFILHAPHFEKPVHWTLEMGRWLAAVSTLLVVFNVALYIFHFEKDKSDIRKINGHTILCGMGEIGYALVNNFEDKKKLVVIEKDIDNEKLSSLKREGIKVIRGNALDPHTLEKGRVVRAKCLIAITGDDFSNLTIIRHANEIYEKNESNNIPIKLAANIDSRNLKTAASQEGLMSTDYNCSFSKVLDEYIDSASGFFKGITSKNTARYQTAKTNLEGYNPECTTNISEHSNQTRLFNINELAARYIYHCYPPDRFKPITKSDEPPVHILLLGYSQMGEELLKLCVQNCHYLNLNKTKITLISLDADSVEQKAINKRNRISEVVDIKFIKFNPHHLSFQFKSLHELGNVDIIYICSPNESTQASYSVKAREIFGNSVPIIRSFSRDVFTHSNSDRNTHNVYVFEKIANYDLIINEAIDRKAIATHNRWLKREIVNYIQKVDDAIYKKSGKMPPLKKTMNTWHLLDDETRDDNRSVVEHNFVKIRAMGQLNQWQDCEQIENADVDFSFLKDKEKVKQLAEMEHRRWMATKYYYGWEYNENRKDECKHHNNLLDFEKLDDTTKKYDYDQISELKEVWELK